MKVFLGADWRGFEMKEKVKKWLVKWGVEFEDLGADCYHPEGDDFSDYAVLTAEKVVAAGKGLGILIGGTGSGMDMAANKIGGIRSVLAINHLQAREARRSYGANILAIGKDYLSEGEIKKTIRFFIETEPVLEPANLRRLEKLARLEKEN